MPDAQPAPAWIRDLTVRINADAAAVFALLAMWGAGRPFSITS